MARGKGKAQNTDTHSNQGVIVVVSIVDDDLR